MKKNLFKKNPLHILQPVIFLIEQEIPYRIFGFMKSIVKKLPKMAKTMLCLRKSHQDYHQFWGENDGKSMMSGNSQVKNLRNIPLPFFFKSKLFRNNQF